MKITKALSLVKSLNKLNNIKDSCVVKHDELDDADIDDLIAEEYEAIADYEAALTQCENATAKERLTHILEEEKEHVRELEELKAKQEPITDAVSPMTYKKLKEKGYSHKDWEKWSDEEKVAKSQGEEGGSKEGSKEGSGKKEKHSKKIEEALEIGPVPSHMRYAGNYNLRVRNKEEFEEVKQELAARGYEAKYEPNPYTRQNVFFKKKTEEQSSKKEGSEESEKSSKLSKSIKNAKSLKEIEEISTQLAIAKELGDISEDEYDKLDEELYNREHEIESSGKKEGSSKESSQERINERVYRMKAPEIKSTLKQHVDTLNSAHQVLADYEKLQDNILSMSQQEYHQKKDDLGSKLQDAFTKVMNDFNIKTESSKNSQGFASIADKENTEQLKLLLKEAGVNKSAMNDVMLEQKDGSSVILIKSLIPILQKISNK